MQEQYRACRCAVFHAKAANRSGALLPGVVSDRRLVADALEPLLRLVLDLSRHAFNAIFPSGGMTFGGFDQQLKELNRHGYRISVLKDPSSTGNDLTKESATSSGANTLATSHLGKLDRLGQEQGFHASADVANLTVHRLDTIVSYTDHPVPGLLTIPTPTGLLSCHHLPTLDLGGLDRLEVLMRWVLDNRRMPRAHWSL